MTTSILERVQGCLMGVAIGDAMGMPWETLSAEKISALTNGQGVVNFSDPKQTRVKDTINLKASDTTDDWQLTKVVTRSLIHCGGWDRVDCAQEHVREYNRSLFGWGGTSTDAVKEIKEGKRDVMKTWWRPQTTLNSGCGNGVVMKVAPPALFETVRSGYPRPEHLLHLCLNLGSITHPDPRASFAAYAVALVIAQVIHHQVTTITREAQNYLLEHLLDEVRKLEQNYVDFRFNSDTLSGRLARISGSLDSAEKVRQTIGSGFMAIETAPFAIATFLRHPTDFRAGVLEAVNAGGDTDTNASIVGAMIGANVGLAGIPEEWRNFRSEFGEAIYLGTELYSSASRK